MKQNDMTSRKIDKIKPRKKIVVCTQNEGNTKPRT